MRLKKLEVLKFHRLRTPLFSLHSLSRPASTASRQPFRSNSDFHFPMPRVMNHGLGFQDSTRLQLGSVWKEGMEWNGMEKKEYF